MFKDRIEAGFLLADKLSQYKDANGVVLAVPRGGVPLGYTVAKELHMPLDLLLTKKIGHPANPEYAIGAVSLTDSFIVRHPEVSESYLDYEIPRVRESLEQMQKKFMGNRPPAKLRDKILILVDDGIATGNTFLSVVKMLKKENPSKIIIASPVASSSSVSKLKSEVDELCILLVPEDFYGVGQFYQDFRQVSDREVQFYLDRSRKEKPGKNAVVH